MAKSAAVTIVLVTRDTVVCADLARGKAEALRGIWSQPRQDLHELSAQVEMALHLGPRPARKTFVLATDFWVQTIELPVHRSHNTTAAEIASALNFEAEALSGLSAFEARVGQVPLGVREGMQTYWLVQVRGDDVDAIDNVVRRAGGRLAGVGHPGGLVHPAAAVSGPSWQRLELWPDTVVMMDGAADGTVDLHVVLLQRRPTTIYVTVVRRNNQLVVRTSDPRTMEQIAALVHQLDVPTPVVLL